MKRILRQQAVAVIGALTLAPALLLGQAQARVHGKVTNSRGDGLAGVRITISDTETSTRLEIVTDAKGNYSVVIIDSSRPRVYKLELSGYRTLDEVFKAPISSNTVKDFEMKTGEEAAVAVQATPASRAVLLYNAGAQLARAGDAAGASQKLRAALELDPDLGPALTVLAAIEIEEGKIAEGLALAEKAISLDPGDVNALRLRFQAYERLGDQEKAAEALAALESASPEDRALKLHNQGVDAYNAGEMRVARAIQSIWRNASPFGTARSPTRATTSPGRKPAASAPLPGWTRSIRTCAVPSGPTASRRKSPR